MRHVWIKVDGACPASSIRYGVFGPGRLGRSCEECELMITVDVGDADHVEMVVAAPFTAPDLVSAGDVLRRLRGTPTLRRVLVVVESIRLPKPDAMWEDLKLTPLIADMRWVAVVTDLEWYGRLSELTGALWPGLTIKHFEPADIAAARAWLASRPDD
jgi:hypothetical protein